MTLFHSPSRDPHHKWTLPSGARLVIQRTPDTDPTVYTSWVVSVPLDVDGSNKRHATIQAFKRAEGVVVLVKDRPPKDN